MDYDSIVFYGFFMNLKMMVNKLCLWQDSIVFYGYFMNLKMMVNKLCLCCNKVTIVMDQINGFGVDHRYRQDRDLPRGLWPGAGCLDDCQSPVAERPCASARNARLLAGRRARRYSMADARGSDPADSARGEQ